MRFKITSSDYAKFIVAAAEKIASEKEYISLLDGTTGDGDHWANINLGFELLSKEAEALSAMTLEGCFKEIGKVMMTKVGGSSGILYGGAYLAAAKLLAGKNEITDRELCDVLETIANDMMRRGNAKPGDKTMIDSLYPAATEFKKRLEDGCDAATILEEVKLAAINGADSTKDMKAVKGRPSYRVDKAVGHLDPGAVTMSYQISALCDVLLENLD